MCIGHMYYITVLPKWLGGGTLRGSVEISSLAIGFSSHQPQSHRGLVVLTLHGDNWHKKATPFPRLEHRRCWHLDHGYCDSTAWHWTLKSASLTSSPGGPEAGSAQSTVGGHWPWISSRVRVFPVMSITWLQTQYDSTGAISNQCMGWPGTHGELVVGVELCPPKKIGRCLTSSTSECDLIWK